MRILYFFCCLFPMLVWGQLPPDPDAEILEYMQLKSNDDTASVAIGTVNSGSLQHGKLMPYQGKNFKYFDRQSYLAGRAFLHSGAKATLLSSYDSLYRLMPTRLFKVMECSNEEGGELFPHKTHQNGLSVDLMMPLLKNGVAYYELDNLGAEHYSLSFDDKGRYEKDPSVTIDFNLVAQQILLINHYAKLNGMTVSKVIIKIELKDELFATHYGQILKVSDIYVVQGLTPIINALHDDHFHLDFGFPYPKTAPAEKMKN